jgi:hypothetical protein
MFKRLWYPETGIFLGLWLILMIGGRSRFFQDPGTFWHTVVGQQMLSSGQLIYHDTFSFTFAGRPWSPHQWLGECLMALLHQLDGLDTLLLATVSILACLYTWLAHRLIRQGLHWSLAAVLVGLTVAASSSHFHIRPHIGTMVFMGLTFGFLCDFEAGRIGLGRMFWLVPLYVLWTNIHGGILGGLGTMGFALAGWCAAWVLGKDTPISSVRRLAIFGLLILGCGLTALVNPYGLQLPRIWLDIMKADLPTIIQEHAPLNPAKPDGWIVLVFGLVYLMVVLSTLPRWPRVTWLLPAIWFYLACTRIRHAPLFSIVAALAVADMLPYTRWAAWLAQAGSDLFQFRNDPPATEKRGLAWRPALLPVGVLLVAICCQLGRLTAPIVGHNWARLDPTYWPVEVLPQLRHYEHARVEGTPIFNEYLFGGFLIYHTPGFRVFVDDRCELYGDQWLKQYVQAEWEETGKQIKEWEEQQMCFDFALTRTGSGFDEFFRHSEKWTLVQETESATLYRRSALALPESSRVLVKAVEAR